MPRVQHWAYLPLRVVVGGAEIVCGALLVLGWKTRAALALLALRGPGHPALDARSTEPPTA